jgi:hypothetical protein
MSCPYHRLNDEAPLKGTRGKTAELFQIEAAGKACCDNQASKFQNVLGTNRAMTKMPCVLIYW